ncbi:UNVERIFIED_CONTAM: hypothetical protein PYX00_011869 [Menopon gallinae]|uniref:Uncharacterized protein n=1 Tax=Menopon gallinae TaxID=328185 RepID=A0AAW2H8N7_9NEOP
MWLVALQRQLANAKPTRRTTTSFKQIKSGRKGCMSEKRKVGGDKDAIKSTKVATEINNLIISESIDKFQKSSIFLQMMSYKKQCMALKRRISELLEEMHMDCDFDENGNNIAAATEDDAADKQHQTAPCKEQSVNSTLLSEECATSMAGEDAKGVNGARNSSSDGMQAKRGVSGKEMIRKYERELISKDQLIAELEKKLCFYKSKMLEKRVDAGPSSDHQTVKDEVERILGENMISGKLRKENIELRKKLEATEYEVEQKMFVYTEQNGVLEERNRFLRSRVAALERDNAEYESEILENRDKYKSIVYEQRNEHLRIEERLVSQLKECQEKLRFFRTECTKLEEEAGFLAQKLSSTIEKYNKLKTQMEALLDVRKRTEAVTDQTLMEELDNLSVAYDKLTREYRDTLERCRDLEEKLCESERKTQTFHREAKARASEVSDNSCTGKHAERHTFDERLFSYEKLRDECEARKKDLIYHRNMCAELSSENEILRQKVECLRGESEEGRRTADRLNTKLNEMRLECNMMAESQGNLMRIIDGITGGRSSEILDDVDKYKKLLKCTACDRRYKDSVINKLDVSFFVSFVEETIQTSHMGLTLSPCALVGDLPDDIFDAAKLVCTKLCPVIFGDNAAKLKKKDDRNLLVITKTPDIYSVYRQDSAIYRQKSDALFKVYAGMIQGMFAKCASEPQVFVEESNMCSYIHLVFGT